jgi:Flp pilus assembly protein TadG
MRKQRFGGDAGVALVEFALVAPLLLFLMIGILDVGRAVNAYVTISNAAREGSHYAALHPTASPGAIESAVRARVVPLDATTVLVTTSYYDGTAFQTFPPSGGIPSSTPKPRSIPVRVEVSYDWRSVTMLVGVFFPSPSLTASSTVDVLR